MNVGDTLYRLDLTSQNNRLILVCDSYQVLGITRNGWVKIEGRNFYKYEPNAPVRQFSFRPAELTDRGFAATKVEAVQEYVKRRVRQHHHQCYTHKEPAQGRWLAHLTGHVLLCLGSAAVLLDKFQGPHEVTADGQYLPV